MRRRLCTTGADSDGRTVRCGFAAWHHTQLPPRRARRSHACAALDVPARLPRSRVCVGRGHARTGACAALGGPQPAWIRALVGTHRRRRLPRQTPGGRYRGPGRADRRPAGPACRPRLGRRGGLEPGRPIPANHEAAADHQLAAPGDVFARAARQRRAASGQRLHDVFVPAGCRRSARRQRLRAHLAVFAQPAWRCVANA